jgi:hypothetical protein
MEPRIIVPDTGGHHNRDLLASAARLNKAGSYRDLSTIIICPTRGVIPATVVQSWMNLARPMNQKVIGPVFIQGMEVGEAYCAAIDMILGNPDLASYKYILSIEEDNCPPPDGLLRLYESIEGKVDGVKYDCVGGLYWVKGDEGQPMCYGDPNVFPKNFIPQIPKPDTVTEANGLGMGFNLWRMSMFTDNKIEKPLFKTVQEYKPGVGAQSWTQDLWFFANAAKHGYRFGCDSRVRVGHWDQANSIMW